ncbi:MAG: hypothetical protein NTX61_02950 [Bacteroidetes bacterium]|nr:hypothetical protein [Bacteroidota bacterium]
MGFQGITWQDIYNFDVGDEFHYTLTASGGGQKIIKTVLAKTSYGNDTVVYTVEHCYQGDGPTGWYSGRDTIIERYNFQSLGMEYWAGHLPLEVDHIVHDGNQYSLLTDRFIGRDQVGYIWGTVCFLQDSCCTGCPGWEYPSGYQYYATGLGNFSSHYYEISEYGTQYFYNYLVYYKKGTETWGTPVATDCDAVIGINEKRSFRKVGPKIASLVMF